MTTQVQDTRVINEYPQLDDASLESLIHQLPPLEIGTEDSSILLSLKDFIKAAKNQRKIFMCQACVISLSYTDGQIFAVTLRLTRDCLPLQKGQIVAFGASAVTTGDLRQLERAQNNCLAITASFMADKDGDNTSDLDVAVTNNKICCET